MAELNKDLVARLERLAEREGVELLAVEVGGAARRPTVRLILDREEGAVTIDDCERVSRQASVLLDAYDPFPGSYNLEVSSPGLDRKFYRPADYARYAGQAVRVRMKPTWTGPKVVEGVLEGLADGHVSLRDREGALSVLPEREVFETRLAPFKVEGSPRRRGKQR
jgi:ribosome maturation factor RimP